MKKPHVLIVDDNPEIRSLIHTTLGDRFYMLGEAPNGEQALEYLEQHDLPDIIILDLAMPGISGFEVLRQIKQDPETVHISVIVLSANAENISHDEAIARGAVAVLGKPFSPLELLRMVEGLDD